MYSDLKNVILYRLNTKETVNRCKKIFKIDLNIPFSVNKNNHQLTVSLNVSLKYFTLLKSTVTQYFFLYWRRKWNLHCTSWSGTAALSWRVWPSAVLWFWWTGREWWCTPPDDQSSRLFLHSLKKKKQQTGDSVATQMFVSRDVEDRTARASLPAMDSSYFSMCSTRLSTSWMQAFLAGL